LCQSSSFAGVSYGRNVESAIADSSEFGRTRTRSQENLALSCAMLLEAEAPLVHGTFISKLDIAKFPWPYRETNPPSRIKIAKKYATDTRLA
jgi:hypothetical protein